MQDLLARIGGMFVHRPYVFVFFAVFLLIAVARMGWLRTALFTLIGWTVAFAAEFSSTRNGIPFGFYRYIDVTRDRELWISNVPFWDSLSFVFLSYLGLSLAIFVYAPLVIERRDFQIADTAEIRCSWRVLFTGAILMALLDVVIDPLTARGDRWFLGKMYEYPAGGIYFGVPISNFVGWAVVGALIIGIFQVIDRRMPRGGAWGAGIRHLPFGGLWDMALYFGVLAFNLALTFWIGEPLLGTIGIILYIPVVILLLSHPLNPDRHATLVDITTHCGDFVRSPLCLKIAADERRATR